MEAKSASGGAVGRCAGGPGLAHFSQAETPQKLLPGDQPFRRWSGLWTGPKVMDSCFRDGLGEPPLPGTPAAARTPLGSQFPRRDRPLLRLLRRPRSTDRRPETLFRRRDFLQRALGRHPTQPVTSQILLPLGQDRGEKPEAFQNAAESLGLQGLGMVGP